MWKSIPFIKLESIWNLWSKSPSKVYNSSSFILHLSTHTDIARISQWASPPSFLNYQHFLNIQNIPCSLHLLRSCSIHIISGLDLLKSLNNLLFAHLPFYFHRESKSKSDLATPVPSISYAFSLNFKDPTHSWPGELSDLSWSVPNHCIKNILPQSLSF